MMTIIPAHRDQNDQWPAFQPLLALEAMVADNNGPGIIAPDKPTTKAVANKVAIVISPVPPVSRIIVFIGYTTASARVSRLMTLTKPSGVDRTVAEG